MAEEKAVTVQQWNTQLQALTAQLGKLDEGRDQTIIETIYDGLEAALDDDVQWPQGDQRTLQNLIHTLWSDPALKQERVLTAVAAAITAALAFAYVRGGAAGAGGVTNRILAGLGLDSLKTKVMGLLGKDEAGNSTVATGVAGDMQYVRNAEAQLGMSAERLLLLKQFLDDGDFERVARVAEIRAAGV